MTANHFSSQLDTTSSSRYRIDYKNVFSFSFFLLLIATPTQSSYQFYFKVGIFGSCKMFKKLQRHLREKKKKRKETTKEKATTSLL